MAKLGPEVCIQHRDPGAPVRGFLERARWLAALVERTGAQLAINGRLDVALLLHAHLHLPVDGPRPRDVRPRVPRDRWVSAAVHDREELAAATGADVFLISPVHPAGSKPDDARPPLGLAGFTALAQLASPTLCVALGGITASTVRSSPPLPAVAAQSAVLRAADPAGVARALLDALAPG